MLEKLIDAAVGNKKAETVLKNGSFVNVFTGEIVKADIAMEGGKIVGWPLRGPAADRSIRIIPESPVAELCN